MKPVSIIEMHLNILRNALSSSRHVRTVIALCACAVPMLTSVEDCVAADPGQTLDTTRVHLAFENLGLDDALWRIFSAAHIPILFEAGLARGRVANCNCEDVTAREALDQVLKDSELTYRVMEDGQVIILKTDDLRASDGFPAGQVRIARCIPVRGETPLFGYRELGFMRSDYLALPAAGSANPYSALSLMPGIQTKSGIEHDLSIRGGATAENLVMLDGYTIFRPARLQESFSPLNPDAIQEIRIYKDVFPARFGGRTSGVVELLGHDRHPRTLKVGGHVNRHESGAFFHTPIADGLSWFVTGRKSHTSPSESSTYSSVTAELDNIFVGLDGYGNESDVAGSGADGWDHDFEPPTASTAPSPDWSASEAEIDENPLAFSEKLYLRSRFTDANSKILWQLNQRDRAAASVFWSHDAIDRVADVNDANIDSERWEQLGMSLSWTRSFNRSDQMSFTLAESSLRNRHERDIASVIEGDSAAIETFESRLSNRIHDRAARFESKWRPHRKLDIEFGAEQKRIDISYDYDNVDGGADSSSSSYAHEERTDQTSLFFQKNWRPTTRVATTYGMRATHDGLSNENYVEPRASVSVRPLARLELKASWGRYRQYVHRFIYDDAPFGSRSFWVLADEELPPGRAEHRSIGVAYDGRGWRAEALGFEKNFSHLLESIPGFTPDSGADLVQLIQNGGGEIRGAEFTLSKNRGPLRGWIAYAPLSYRFESTSQPGTLVSSYQDTRHEVKTVGSLRFGSWQFSGNWVWINGPQSYYEDADGVRDRLSAYHRLDLALTRSFTGAGRNASLSFSLLNVYDRDNVSTWVYLRGLDHEVPSAADGSISSITPAVSLRFELGGGE